MTYIINYNDACVSICRDLNQLTDEINSNFRNWKNNHTHIESVIVLEKVKYIYFVYEFDERLIKSKPVSKKFFFKYLNFLLHEKANIRNIYEYTNQTKK